MNLILWSFSHSFHSFLTCLFFFFTFLALICKVYSKEKQYFRVIIPSQPTRQDIIFYLRDFHKFILKAKYLIQSCFLKEIVPISISKVIIHVLYLDLVVVGCVEIYIYIYFCQNTSNYTINIFSLNIYNYN